MIRAVLPSPAPLPSLAPGHGRLAVARVGDASAVVGCAATNPLKLLHQRHGAAAWAYAATFGGGLMPGDDLALRLDVGPAARLFATSQSATKVFAARDGVGARARVSATVGAGAVLALWSDPVAAFAGARFDGATVVELAADAGVLVVDTITCGRAARGERWSFDRCATRSELRRGGAPLAIEALRLDRGDGDIAARLPGCDAYATAILAGPPLAPLAAEVIAAIAERDPRAAPRVAVSPLADGCVLRVAGEGVEAVVLLLRALLAGLAGLIGGDPWSHRH